MTLKQKDGLFSPSGLFLKNSQPIYRTRLFNEPAVASSDTVTPTYNWLNKGTGHNTLI